MTNEEIIKNYTTVLELGFNVKETSFLMKAARKDEAIAFADWTVKEDYKPGAGNEHWFKWNGIECEKIPYTTEQLYQLFKSQDNK